MGCTKCEYIYDESIGDTAHGVPAGTRLRISRIPGSVPGAKHPRVTLSGKDNNYIVYQ